MISSATIYGGTSNLFTVTLKRFGIQCTLVDPDAPEEELEKEFGPTPRRCSGRPSPTRRWWCWTLKNLPAWLIATACR